MPSERFEDRRLQTWIDDVVQHWEQLALSAVTRHRLRNELTQDLVTALAAGATVDELVAHDPAAFAADVADSSGVQPPAAPSIEPPTVAPAWQLALTVRRPLDRTMTYRNLCGTALAGGIVGALASLFFVYPSVVPVYALVDQSPETIRPGLEFGLVMALHTVAAAATLAVACAVVALRFGRDPTTRRTLAFVAPLMGVTGAASVLPTMALARFFSYSGTPLVVLLEAMVVSAYLVGGIVAGRWLAVKRAPRRSPVPTGQA